MRHAHRTIMLVAALAMSTGGGCSQIQTVFHQPTTSSGRATSNQTTHSTSIAPNRAEGVRAKVGCAPDAPNSNRKTRQYAELQTDSGAAAPRARTASYMQAPPQEIRRTAGENASVVQIDRVGKPPQQPTESATVHASTNGLQDGEQKNVRADRPDSSTKARFTSPGIPYRNIAALTGLAVLGTTTTGSGSGSAFSQSQVTTAAGSTGRPGLGAPSPTVANVTQGNIGVVNVANTAQGFAAPNTIFGLQTNLASGVNGGCATLARAGFTVNHALCRSGKHH